MKVAVELCYTISAHAVLDLPEGKTWDDVRSHYCKWGKLYLQFNDTPDGEYVEFDCGDANYDSVDWKYPRQYSVTLPADMDGDIEPDYDNCLLEAIP
jgi:hypothetical protein